MDINEEALQLRIMWSKAQNMYSSFFTRLQAVRDEIGDDVAFSKWCIYSLEISVDVCIVASNLLKEADAKREREKLSRVKQVARDTKRRDTAEEQRRKTELRLKREDNKREAMKAKARKQKAKLVVLPLGSSPSAEALQLLAECAQIESNGRIELGRVYAALKERVDMRMEGKDANGRWWTWTRWAEIYISRSERDIRKCLTEYNEFKMLNRASCPVSQTLHVVNSEGN
jgi:hypothetical protein